MRVLITGMAGFLGTHVAELFKKEGWDVCGIDNLNELELKRTKFDIKKSREHNLKFLESIGAKLVIEDCRYISAAEIIYQFGDIDFIIHCSAQPAMTIALELPLYDADNNIISVVNMLEIAKKLNCPFVNCSSVHVYGNEGDKYLIEKEDRFYSVPEEINEEEPILLGELTPLHVSKYATELYTNSFAQIYGLKAANFRFTGMYGERQFGGMDHGWVANFAIRTIKDREITVFGTDKQVRDILYASDAANAFLSWFTNGQRVGTYNIGGGIKNAISLKQCLYKLKLINKKQQDIKILPKRIGDLHYFVCDYRKANKEFNWEPKISPDEGLQKISKWIEENKDVL